MTQGNNLLGKFYLKGIPPMPCDAFNEDAVCFGIFEANDDVICATNARNLVFCVGREQTHRPEAG